MEESCLVDLDQAMDDHPAIDGELLMIEDVLPASDHLVDDGDVDRLSHVIRSFEAEIIDDGEAAGAMMFDNELALRDDDGGRLGDLLSSDLEDHEGGSFWHCWLEEAPCFLEVDDGVFMYMDGHEGSITAAYETVDHQQYCYVETLDEQVYIPLWE